MEWQTVWIAKNGRWSVEICGTKRAVVKHHKSGNISRQEYTAHPFRPGTLRRLLGPIQFDAIPLYVWDKMVLHARYGPNGTHEYKADAA